MELHVVGSPEEYATVGADVVQSVWLAAGAAPLLVATGATPMPVYRELGRRVEAGRFEPPPSAIVQLDEYVGVREDDPRSLYRWMRTSFLEPLGLDERRVVRLRGDVPDVDAACARFEHEVGRLGGIGLALLGLGPNGHLGFNEPPSAADAPTRLVPLSPASLVSNARYWEGQEVPTEAVTTGMALILSASTVVLLVTGRHKRDILRRCLEGPETDDVPASHLRRARRLIVVCDRAARDGDGD